MVKNIAAELKTPNRIGLFAFAAVFSMIFIMGLQKNYSPDLGFHLRSAKWMIENKSFISTDSFTYTSAGNNYYNLQWMYQLIIYFIYSIGKDALLVLLNSLLITFSFYLAWTRYSRLSELKYGYSMFLLVALIGAQAILFEIRPHVLSWFYLNIVLLILESYKRSPKTKLFFLPAIILLWVNTHSLAILGLVVIGIYLVGIYLETKKTDKLLLKYAAFSLVAFLINPYFIDGLLFPFSQLGIIKGDTIHKSYMGEMQSPFTLAEFRSQGWSYLANPLFYMQIYALCALSIGIRAILKIQMVQGLLIVTFFIILYLAIKNYGYFLMATMPLMACSFNEILNRKKSKTKVVDNSLNKRLKYISLILAIVISWLSVTDGYSILRQSPYRFGLTVDEHSLPVEATSFLNKNKIYGKMLNHLEFGGYLMYHYKEKVFIDGRMELPDQKLLQAYFDCQKPGGLNNLLKVYDPEVVIFPYVKASSWFGDLLENKNFRPIYFDGLAVIYVKHESFPKINSITKESLMSEIHGFDLVNSFNSIQVKKPSRMIAVVQSFLMKQYFPIVEQSKATFCFTYGFEEAALYYSVLGINNATINPNNMYYNLFLYYKSQNQTLKASYCLNRSK